MKILLAALILGGSAHAELRETRTVSDVVPAISTGTLLVMDIDNTTLEPVGQLGSDQWYYYLVKIVGEDKAGELWTSTLKTVKVKPAEPTTPAFLRDQQKRGVKVMALTARGVEDAEATFAQLKAIGVDYAATAPVKKELKTVNKGLFKNGVFFQGEGPSKGETLLAFIKENKLKPERVVFVDDKVKHATSVEKVLRENGVPVISFRYGAVDDKVNFFNALMDETSAPAVFDLLFKGK
jgi:phosphoglycolate phosphatase-like HAD superfamily hydrolase